MGSVRQSGLLKHFLLTQRLPAQLQRVHELLVGHWFGHHFLRLGAVFDQSEQTLVDECAADQLISQLLELGRFVVRRRGFRGFREEKMEL